MSNGKTHYMLSERVGPDRWEVWAVGAEKVPVGEFFLDGQFWKISSGYATKEEEAERFVWSGHAFKLLWNISVREGFSQERESR